MAAATTVFDKSKIEITQLPCYLCDTMITDSRHALRHFETSHPGFEYDSRQVQVSGIELANGDDLDESTEDLEATATVVAPLTNNSSSDGSNNPPGQNAQKFSKVDTEEDSTTGSADSTSDELPQPPVVSDQPPEAVTVNSANSCVETC